MIYKLFDNRCSKLIKNKREITLRNHFFLIIKKEIVLKILNENWKAFL